MQLEVTDKVFPSKDVDLQPHATVCDLGVLFDGP